MYDVNGARLYDRRLDSTNGGTGTQREDQYTTLAYSSNAALIIENIMRGILLPDGRRWGVNVEDWLDLPASSWNAAKSYAASKGYNKVGYEIRMATADYGGDDPWDVIDEFAKACSADIADVGGTFFIRCGPPELPSFSITDDDIIVSQPQESTQHEGTKNIFNTIRATFVNPAEQWKASEAPIRRNSTWITQDGEELVGELHLSAVWDRGQAQQLMGEYIKDSRRTRAHTIVLPRRSRGPGRCRPSPGLRRRMAIPPSNLKLLRLPWTRPPCTP
jgi:hypothetical protein